MSRAQVDRLRTGAALAAVVLALLSRGDTSVLAVALVATAWRPAAVSVVVALLATSWRWGSTSLEAIAGAQSVLGPAALVGPSSAAAAAGLAAVTVLLAAPRPISSSAAGRLIVALASGAAVGVVLAGSGPGGDLWQRGVVSVGAAGTALWLGRLRDRRTSDRALDALSGVAALGTLLAVAVDAPGWSGTVDGAALLEGAAILAAAVALVSVGHRAVAAMGDRPA
ncbi:MAG: hypothetical protein ACT452_06780 [Microthrixaceae bacterium]